MHVVMWITGFFRLQVITKSFSIICIFMLILKTCDNCLLQPRALDSIAEAYRKVFGNGPILLTLAVEDRCFPYVHNILEFTSPEINLVRSLQITDQWSMVIGISTEREVSGFILIHSTAKQLRAQLQYLAKAPGWNPRAPVFAVVPDNAVTEASEALWSHHATSSLVLALPSTDVFELEFRGPPLCHWVPRRSRVKRPSPLHEFRGCVVNVTTYDWNPYVVLRDGPVLQAGPGSADMFDPLGVDTNLLNLLSERINFKVSYRITTHMGASVNDIATGLAHIVIGGVPRGPGSFFSTEDHSVCYYGDRNIWLVPMADDNSWTRLSGVFASEVWLGILATSLGVAVVLRVFARPMDTDKFRNLFHCLGALCSVLCGVPLYTRPRGNAARVVLLSYALHAIVLDTAYLSAMFRNVAYPSAKYAVSTLAELADSNLIFANMRFTLNFLITVDDAEVQKILSRFTECKGMDEVYWHLFTARDSCILLPQITTDFLRAGDVYDEKGRRKFTRLPEVFSTSYVTVALRKWSPLLPRVDQILLRALQAGLVTKWLRAVDSRVRAQRRLITNYDALVLHQLQSVFGILAVGHAVAIVVFCFETRFPGKRLE